MKDQKIVKKRRSYESDFKQEMARMLTSGKSAREISETFGIAENLVYRWKRLATMKTKSNNSDSSGDKTAKLTAEIIKLRAENERLKADREILKKALGILSQSDSGTSMS